MRVLFSPVGTTDPISNNHDGGMLHICRLYQPDRVYLYLTKEMCYYHDLDDRYRKAIHLLGEDLGWNCQIEVFRDESMAEVQIFDAFIDTFEKKLDMIRLADAPQEILVNISSGTPAMKSSLQIISMLQNDVTAVQVSTPNKSSNARHEDKDDYDLEIQWECDDDRKPDFENRCIVSDAKKLLDRIRKESIQKYIEAYDYEAAKILAETLSISPGKKFWEGLDMANNRKALNLKYVNGKRKQCHLEHWFPICKERDMEEYEYLLVMQIKLRKNSTEILLRTLRRSFIPCLKKP